MQKIKFATFFSQGLGIEFLRHIERCLCLLFVIDLSQPDPVEQLRILKSELEHYKPGLSERPHAIVGNKVDLEDAKENAQVVERFARDSGIPCFNIAGKIGLNVREVLLFMKDKFDENLIKETAMKEERKKMAEREMQLNV